jgi:hypothetical protein
MIAPAGGRLRTTQPRFRRRRGRRGYILVMVLVVLAIAAAALAGICRMSLERAVQASRAEEDLQRRWAVLTCRSVLLPKAEAVLVSAAEPAPEVRREVRLGRQSFTLVFGDEQAKANVNRLYRTGGLAEAERGVRTLAARTDGVAVELRPLPVPPRSKDDDADDPPPAFESFGQVFLHPPPAALIERPAAGLPPAAVLTCWGDGSIHFRRASSEALREVCARHANGAQVGRLLQIRSKRPDIEASEALDQLTLTDRAREALDDLLVDESACHSLWIISRSERRTWYDLAVEDASAADEGHRVMVFSW